MTIIVHRRLRPFKLISLDLDDTLYFNRPILVAAEQAQQEYLLSYVPEIAALQPQHWHEIKRQVLIRDPSVADDISRWRLRAIETALGQLGLSQQRANSLAEHAFTAFLQVRQAINLDAEIIKVVETLASQYPIAVITNGNADHNKLAVSHCIATGINANQTYRSKPNADMFLAVASQHKIKCADILHVGDHHRTDVYGGRQAGCQTVWTDQFLSTSRFQGSLLADIDISNLAELLELL